MSALKNYCDKIHEYICQYGEDYIWHIAVSYTHLTLPTIA